MVSEQISGEFQHKQHLLLGKRNVVKFDYRMNDIVLCRTDSIKDLGIDISSSLVWNDHMIYDNQCRKVLMLLIHNSHFAIFYVFSLLSQKKGTQMGKVHEFGPMSQSWST